MMHKYVAVIEMTSWLGTHQHIVRGDTPSALIEDFENVQNLHCLVMMGRGEEDDEGQRNLDILEDILNQCENSELIEDDFKMLDIEISLGRIRFIEAFVGEGNEEKLKAKYPNAR